MLAHPAARWLLEGSRREVSAFWVDGKYGVPCKARFDLLNHGGIGDVKTCADASPDAFVKSIGSFYYHLQAAFYFNAAEHALEGTPEFFAFIAVESEPPYEVACYQLDSASLLAGARLADIALARYKAAIDSGKWPGYVQTIEKISAPRWALRMAAP